MRYWNDGVPWHETRYRNWNDGDPFDQTEVYFNAKREPLYTVRRERVGDRHVRRYYNDQLVCEARWDVTPPEVRYYELDGTVLLEYVSPTWHLHGEDPLVLVETREV